MGWFSGNEGGNEDYWLSPLMTSKPAAVLA